MFGADASHVTQDQQDPTPRTAVEIIKIWSQAGATLVAAVIAMALGFDWIQWTQAQTALVLGVYAAVMIVLRQMFSLTPTNG